MPQILLKHYQLTITLWVMVSFFSSMKAQTRLVPIPMLPAPMDCSKGMVVTGELLKFGFGNVNGIFGGAEDNRSDCWGERYTQHSLDYFGLAPAPAEEMTGDELWGKADAASGEMALKYFVAATREYLAGRDWVMACWSHLAFANKRIKREETAQAKTVLEELTVMTGRVPIDDENLLEIDAFKRSLYGDIYNLEGDYRQAIKQTRIALEQELLKPELSETDSFYVATYFQSLGSYYLNIGDLDQSASCFYKADDFDGPRKTPSPETNYKLGSIAILQNNPEKAVRYLDKCLDRIIVTGGKHRLKVKALIGKSVSWQIKGAYGTALEFSRQATEVETSEGKYLAWSSLGSCYLRLYQPDLALAMLDSAATAYLSSRQAMQESKGFLSDLYRITGEAHLLTGDATLALRYFQRALVENHQYFTDSLNLASNPGFAGVKDPIDFIRALRLKAKAWSSTAGNDEQWTKSLTTYELAMEWIDSLRSNFTSETAELGWSETFKSTFEGGIEVAYQLFNKTQQPAYLEKAFLFAEKSKNALLFEQLKSAQGKSYAGIPEAVLAREKELLVDLAYYTKALRSAEEETNTTRIGLYRPYLAQTRIDLVSHQEMMEQNYPKYQQLKNEAMAPTPASVRSDLLDVHTAFLSYFIGHDSAYAIVITKASAVFFSLGASVDINLKINNFLKQLKDVDNFSEAMTESKQAFVRDGALLYDAILKEAIATLPQTVDRLIIAADGNLTGIPLSALPRTENGPPSGSFRELPYLLHDYRVQYAYSAALQLEARQQRPKRPAKMECFGLAPDYQHKTIANHGVNAVYGAPKALAGTARELKNIFHYVTGNYDTTTTATKELFLSNAGDFNILHLAMHGLADPMAPDLNHLVFADADGQGGNLLYHHEIANMDLSARLVVLSACETGVGKHEVGEGVFSLARSFSYAGIPSIVMSLWSADDASTSKLMPAFYEQLAAGTEQHVALQQAKLSFLKDAGAEHLHPYFWAAFVGIGDTTPVINNGWAWWWWLGVVVLGGGLCWGLSRLLFSRKLIVTQDSPKYL